MPNMGNRPSTPEDPFEVTVREIEGVDTTGRDFDDSTKQAVWDVLGWLLEYQSTKAQHCIRLFTDRRYAQALDYYSRNKF